MFLDSTARDLGGRVRFSDVRNLRSRIGDAISEEERKAGQTQVWRRLKLLRGAIDRALDGATETAAQAERRAVAAGDLTLEATIGNRIAAASQGAAPNAGSAVFTPSGRRLDVRYEVVEADSLIPSYTSDMARSPDFPAALQPRDRGRVASEVQVNRIASELQPERLGASTSAMDGAPIVGPDGVVESGNARTLGIIRAHEAGGERSQAYRDFLAAQGFEVRGVRAPLLIRRRLSDLSPDDRVAFTREANVSSGLSLSVSERAAMDAERMPDALLDLYASGDVTAASNRDFVRGFLQAVSRPGEEGAFVTSGGELSQEGAQRVRGALLHAAYEDTPLVASLMENSDEGLRAFGGALSDVASDVARLRRGILAGNIDPGVDIGRAAVEAANLIKSAKARNMRLADLVGQQDAFGQISEDALSLLRLAYGDDLRRRISRSDFADLLRAYIVEAVQQVTDARLFGEALGSAQILEGVRARYGGQRGRAASDPQTAGGAAARAFAGAEGTPGGRPGPVPGRPENAGAGRGRAEVIGQADTAPTLDSDAVARLRAANDFNQDFKSRFDRGLVGSVLSGGGRGEYRILSSAVPQRVFTSGPRGFQTVQAYRKAVGDGEAMLVLQDHAAASLRAAAVRAGGTLDPAKVARWRARHAAALRAFPDLDRRFADAAAASETLAAASQARKVALDDFQKGAVGKLLGADDPETVVNVVGRVFGAADALPQMRRLASLVSGDPNARQGLRRAIVDYMLRQFVGSGDAPQPAMFQKFINRNAGVLRQVFFEAEVKMMQRVALDLKRSAPQRGKIPGGSDTAQNLKSGGQSGSLLGRLVAGAFGRESLYGGAGGFAVGGPLGALVGAGGAEVVRAIRQAGLAKVDDLIADAMLNPARANALLERVPDRLPVDYVNRVARLYRGAAIFGGARAAVGEDAERAFDPETRTPSAILSMRRALEDDPVRWAAVKHGYLNSTIADALGSVDANTAFESLDLPTTRSPAEVGGNAAILHAALTRAPVQANLKAALTPDEWSRLLGVTVVLRRAVSIPFLGNASALAARVGPDVQDAALPLLRKLSDVPNVNAAMRALAGWATADAVTQSRALSGLILSSDEKVQATAKELRRLSPIDKRWPILFGHLLRQSGAFEKGQQEEVPTLPMAVGQ